MTEYPALCHVLCVDDETDILDIIQLSLEMVGGLQVTRCQSSLAAVAMAEACMPDMILLDMMMPQQDGAKTLEHLRATPAVAAIPVIFMTARVQRTEIEEYLGMGAVGVLSKPFDPMTLADDISRIWRQYHAA